MIPSTYAVIVNVIEYRSVLYGALYVEKAVSQWFVLHKSLYWLATGLCVPLKHVNISVPILYDIGYFRYLQNDTIYCNVERVWRIFDVDEVINKILENL